jgi:hypothetical protein
MVARLSALHTSRTLPPGFFIFKDSWYSFLLETESTPGPVRPEGLGQFKKSIYIFFYYYYLVCEAIGTMATPGLLCQPRVIVKMIVEKQKECSLAGETKVLRENLPQHHFCPSQNPTWPDPGLNPGRCGGKLATNRLSYGVALYNMYNSKMLYLSIL